MQIIKRRKKNREKRAVSIVNIFSIEENQYFNNFAVSAGSLAEDPAARVSLCPFAARCAGSSARDPAGTKRIIYGSFYIGDFNDSLKKQTKVRLRVSRQKPSEYIEYIGVYKE
jgi:hypothetical protein